MSIHTSSSIICSCAFPSLRCSQRSNLREKTEEPRTSERPQRSAAALRLDLHFSTIMDLHYSAIIHKGVRCSARSQRIFTEDRLASGGRMVHHSIAVVITSFLTNFVERRQGEVRRITLPRTPLNKAIKRVRQ